MMSEDEIFGKSDKELWTHRHELTVMLRGEIGSSTMDSVDELLTVERALVRREKRSIVKLIISRLGLALENY